MAFDYNSPAEIFIPKSKRRHSLTAYRRFATAAEAIRFVIEEFPAIRTLGVWMHVEDDRFALTHWAQDIAGIIFGNARADLRELVGGHDHGWLQRTGQQ